MTMTVSLASSGYTIRAAAVANPDLYIVSRDRVAFPVRQSWLEASSTLIYNISNPESQKYGDRGLDLLVYSVNEDADVVERLVDYINSTATGVVPKETDHDIAFRLFKLADEQKMPMVLEVLTRHLMSAVGPTVIQALEAYVYMAQSDGKHQPLEDYYKSVILSNPAWLSAKRVDPAGDLWRFSVPTGSRTGNKGIPKGTEHDVHIPASVACDLWHALYQGNDRSFVRRGCACDAWGDEGITY